MRFIVDCMLGKLAKWLKILGFDTLYFSRIDDNALLSRAAAEDRTLLTRDTGLLERARAGSRVSSLFIRSENWEDQVVQVLDDFDLRRHIRRHTRCIDCNVKLEDLARTRARNLVAPFIYQKSKSFALCPLCGRVFWRGTHFRDMDIKLDEILGRQEEAESTRSHEGG